MNPSPAASMIGPLTRPNVMTVFAAVFTMPIVSGTRGKGCGWGAVKADDRRDQRHESPFQNPQLRVFSRGQGCGWGGTQPIR